MGLGGRSGVSWTECDPWLVEVVKSESTRAGVQVDEDLYIGSDDCLRKGVGQACTEAWCHAINEDLFLEIRSVSMRAQ